MARRRGRKATGTRAWLRPGTSAPAIYLITDLARALAVTPYLVSLLLFTFPLFLGIPCLPLDRFHFTSDFTYLQEDGLFPFFFLSTAIILQYFCLVLLGFFSDLTGRPCSGRLHPTGKWHHPFYISFFFWNVVGHSVRSVLEPGNERKLQPF